VFEKERLDEVLSIVYERLAEVNKEQEKIRLELGDTPPQYVAHATHVSQERYRESAPDVYKGKSAGESIVPVFPKATQNELGAVRALQDAGIITAQENRSLRDYIEYPKRVFAASTMTDHLGNPVLDEQGKPVPNDVSYAYSLKACSASINYVDGDLPLLIGFEGETNDKHINYSDFEQGKYKGHIYIGRGDSFKPEHDKNGNVTEYTSSENMAVVHHIETTPQDAMERNVQFVIFRSENDYNKWAEDVHEYETKNGESFQTFLPSDAYRITSLQKSIENGEAVFVNATDRGCNPKINCLSEATASHNAKNNAAIQFHNMMWGRGQR
jgi:hypothetical protein